jgi:hypothetical protein
MLWRIEECVRDVASNVRVSVSPAAGGVHLPFIGQGEGELQACHTI